jgi:hypothetical protein
MKQTFLAKIEIKALLWIIGETDEARTTAFSPVERRSRWPRVRRPRRKLLAQLMFARWDTIKK